MKIRLIGHRNNMGIGVHYSNFADALKRVRYWGDTVEEVDCENPDAVWAAAGRSQPEDINITFVSMPIQGHYKGTTIQWVVSESTRVPPTIMSTMLAADVVWVPSTWGRDCLIENGLEADRCDVVPEGVDSARYHPYGPTAPSPVLRYLITGKYELRKSIIETVYAWHQEFANDPLVELVVKTTHFIHQEQKQEEITSWIKRSNMTNVRVLWGAVNDQDMANLYQQADVFVLPSKGEGWGLPLIEAAASGLPIITTMYSGQTEFLQHITSSVLPVEYDMAPITCAEYQLFYPTTDGNWGNWAQPRIDSIRQAFKASRLNYNALKEQAQRNSEIIRRDFSWDQCAYRALQSLQTRGLLSKNSG